MQPPFPCPVKTWHNDTYAAISPTRPELEASGKTVVITGAGGTIGRETALAFAQAGAKHIALVGRTLESLEEAKATIPKTTEVSIIQADISKVEDVNQAASAVGTWDILILAAGYVPKPGYIAAVDTEDYWSAFEGIGLTAMRKINAKSVVVAVQAFTPQANPVRAVVLGLFSGAICFPTQATAGLSGYLVSKMAQAKLLEYVAAENEHLFVASVHPGMIDSPLFRASGATPDKLPMDTATLAAHFTVWMASQEARDLRGKLVWANWDVDELRQIAAEQKTSPTHTVGALGWPFSFEA